MGLKGCGQHASKMFALTHTFGPWAGSRGPFFPESDHVAFKLIVPKIDLGIGGAEF